MTWLIFLLGAGLLLGYAVSSMPVRRGDGHEYSLVSQAFLSHLSPDIRVEDIQQREDQLQQFPSRRYVPDIFEDIKSAVLQEKEESFRIYRAKNGQYYGCHFWLYPAYAAAVETLFGFLGANPLAGFQLANALLFILVLGYCLFFVQKNLSRRLTLIAAFTLGGSLFYLKWTHPEFFIVAFLFIGFSALYQRSFKVAFLCLALAAVQVITLWAAFAAIPLLILLQYKREEAVAQIRMLSKKWWAWVCAVLPASSLVFYAIHYGKLSLIGEDFTDIRLVSFSHLVSFWFDLDQGVFVGAPWLIPVLFIFLIRIKKISRVCRLDLVTALFSALCICIPLLVHTNVNSGQSVFQRYALYAVCPVTAWAGLYFFEIVKKRWAQYLLAILAVCYVAAFSGANAEEDHMRHKPWTRFLLENFPEKYNPEPGIFYVRTGHIDPWTINAGRAVVYRDQQGVVRKILFPIDQAEKVISNLCSGRLVDEQGNAVDYLTASHEAYGWAYLNGRFFCEGFFRDRGVDLNPRYEASPASGIDFRRDGFPSFVDFAGGLSGHEPWGRWSDGDTVLLEFKKPLPEKFKVCLVAKAFGPNAGKEFVARVEKSTNRFVLNRLPAEQVLLFDNPEKSRVMTITIPSPVSPKALGMSSDERRLGMGFVELRIIPL